MRTEIYSTVETLAAAIEAKDMYTSKHVRRVADLAEAIAEELGLDAEEVREVRTAALLHDVGKVWVNDSVLHKNGALNEEEWIEMRRHPQFGWSALVGVEDTSLRRIARGLLLHHERIDGRGYPFGLCGEEVPLLARIIAVADTFDAMTSDRPYRKALSAREAYAEIARNRGTQFCEKVVDAFFTASRMEERSFDRIGDSP
jgi:HD-GYP domain-containing protein (c-di-GMP phosphodiesterase class II)